MRPSPRHGGMKQKEAELSPRVGVSPQATQTAAGVAVSPVEGAGLGAGL
jgi:hypothetical protein